MSPTTIPIDLTSLRAELSGPALAPGDEGWDAARQAWNLAVDQHPAAIAYAQSATDVAAAIRFARAAGLRVAPQGTGHGAGPLGDLSGTLLLKTERMAAVEVDPKRRRALVGAGALWGDVAVAAAPHGLVGLHGSSGGVGVAGYTLGGGIGWLSRLHGLASNSVTAVELVDAAGEPRRVDAEHDPDLFWALRGGGGDFVVVTGLELELFALREAHAGMLVWPAERGPEVLRAWRDWVRTVPEQTGSSFRWLQLPPLPEVPEPLRGKRTVAITAAHAGPAAEADELLAPLRALGGQTMDSFTTMPAADLRYLNGDPEQPSAALGDQSLLAELPEEAVAALCAVAGPEAAGPLAIVELRHAGGALGRAPEGAGALARLDGEFVMFALAMLVPGADPVALRSALGAATGAVAPWSSGSYLNFVEDEAGTAAALPAETWRRLREIKARVDPEGTLQSSHPLPRA